MAVAHRDGGVTEVLLHHQLCHRFAHDVRPSENDTVLSRGLYAVALQQRDDAERCGGDEAGQAYRHASDIDGVEAVNVFLPADFLYYVLLVDVTRQRQLHDEAINVVVVVQLVDAI